MLKAGMARADITPPQGLELAGYPHYPRNNTGAHDPLWATCMYLENEEEAVAMVTLDLLFFSKKHTAGGPAGRAGTVRPKGRSRDDQLLPYPFRALGRRTVGY